MSEALANIEDVKNDMTLSQVGKLFAQSGFFADARGEAQAITKIMAGRENGFGAFTSMSGIHIIKGKMELGADLLATAIKRSGKYNYRVKVMTESECSVEFFEKSEFTGGKWEKSGVSTFTMQDAQKAGLTSNDTWRKYARNMLFARAMSNGQAWFCPDVFQSRVYTEGEISGYTEEPEHIEAEIVHPQPQPQNNTAERLERAYDAIEELTSGSHPKAIANSVKKHLDVDDVRECQDLKQVAGYFQYKADQMADKLGEFNESAMNDFLHAVREKEYTKAACIYDEALQNKGAFSVQEIEGMRAQIKQFTPENLEDFEQAINDKKWKLAQDAFDAACAEADIVTE